MYRIYTVVGTLYQRITLRHFKNIMLIQIIIRSTHSHLHRICMGLYIQSICVYLFIYQWYFVFCSGIGFAVAERLLEWDPSIKLCLACRNQTKAEAARNELLLQHPTSQIDLIPVDVSSVKSIYDAAAQIKER